MSKYIAQQSIGHFMPGDEIKGLSDERIQALLVSGAIAEPKEPELENNDGATAQLASLTAENVELKAKVTELEKSLAASEKKLAAEIKKTVAPEK
ncbi:hypothetical protein DJ533_10575 [Acinetobacter defluvii]|uniref:Uncharacterized protein n=1 Tax=Acinetobacter defluvii TaxID=1871111 RepID=A0A2S2FDJ3_9GAMM|nr:hypothetical protein [Acinetobacter defluvii]AWL28978.1 hypothetical protein DJ533_10575 [Acinetobacter defluvii]